MLRQCALMMLQFTSQEMIVEYCEKAFKLMRMTPGFRQTWQRQPWCRMRGHSTEDVLAHTNNNDTDRKKNESEQKLPKIDENQAHMAWYKAWLWQSVTCSAGAHFIASCHGKVKQTKKESTYQINSKPISKSKGPRKSLCRILTVHSVNCPSAAAFLVILVASSCTQTLVTLVD